MDRITAQLVGLTISLASTSAWAQQAMHFDEDYALQELLYETLPVNKNDSATQLESISLKQLSELRANGIDPSWIANRFTLPSFQASEHQLTQNEHPLLIESWATHYTNQQGVALNDSLLFSVGRTTELRDGNISGSEGTLNSKSGRDHLPSLTQAEGEYDVYDLSLEWKAINTGDVTISLLSGFKAIEANIGKRVTNNGDTTIETVNRFAAIPMVGSGVRWQINDSFSFSGTALTHPIDAGDALIDFNASTDLKLSTNIGFSAGYRIIRSSFEVGSVDTGVDQEGLFARLQISF